MKNLFAFVLIFLLAASANAADVLFGGLVTVNNTTSNSTSVAVTTFTVPAQSLLVTHSGLTATNDLTGYAQVSLDGTNFVNIATYRPATTNAETESVIMSPSVQTVYLRFSAVTTNSVGVAVLKQ